MFDDKASDAVSCALDNNSSVPPPQPRTVQVVLPFDKGGKPFSLSLERAFDGAAMQLTTFAAVWVVNCTALPLTLIPGSDEVGRRQRPTRFALGPSATSLCSVASLFLSTFLCLILVVSPCVSNRR